MRSGLGTIGIRTRLLQVLGLIAVAGCVAILWGAASTPSAAPARADVRSAEAPPSPAPERAESRFVASGGTVPDAAPYDAAMREAHSDGGYWYWFERQQASP
jgi:hypothetical protein